jgi:hypothetical protein
MIIKKKSFTNGYDKSETYQGLINQKRISTLSWKMIKHELLFDYEVLSNTLRSEMQIFMQIQMHFEKK